MPFVSYRGPADTFDARPLLGDDNNHVFHTPTNMTVAADQRGNITELSDEQAQELLTRPGHSFILVPEEQARAAIEVQNRNAAQRRQLQEAQQATAAAQVTSGFNAVPQQTLPPSQITPQMAVAPAAPRLSDEIRSEVAAEMKALRAVERDAAKERRNAEPLAAAQPQQAQGNAEPDVAEASTKKAAADAARESGQPAKAAKE